MDVESGNQHHVTSVSTRKTDTGLCRVPIAGRASAFFLFFSCVVCVCYFHLCVCLRLLFFLFF